MGVYMYAYAILTAEKSQSIFKDNPKKETTTTPLFGIIMQRQNYMIINNKVSNYPQTFIK